MSTKQFPSPRLHSGEVRVVVQNLWGRRGAWAERRSVLIAGLAALQPDLVVFNEAIKNQEYDQVLDLLGPSWNVAHQSQREAASGEDVEEGQGFSIASRWPIEAVHELDLHVTPRTAGFACGALVAEILAAEPVGPLLLGYHNPNWQLPFAYERERQAVATAQFVEEIVSQRHLHMILAADLDADPESSSARFWCGRQSLCDKSVCYRDAWESIHPGELGHTFTPNNPLVVDRDWPFRRIDYLFVRCGEHGGPTLAITSCQRIFDEPRGGVWASDHFGLVADLTIPTRR
jgi:endonuclease/exonuclease/phosphatase family metal-dependent hydrolase